MTGLDGFHPATRQWFEANFAAPTAVQSRGWTSIRRGKHTLLVAPTGSGKTLAAFLASIDRLSNPEYARVEGVRVIYVSPLKALVYDIERNLRAPLAGIEKTAVDSALARRAVSIAVRTGDTPQKERQRQARDPADILVTTPESLYLMLGSKMARTLSQVEVVIVDEIHALAPTKRGAHLALSLERLTRLNARDPQRIGLSATARPLQHVARFLGGERPVNIIDASAAPALDLRVSVTVPDMQNPTPVVVTDGDVITPPEVAAERAVPNVERGIWPTIYPQLLSAIRAHRASIVFVNSRGLCERLAQKLNELAEEELVLAHHGSISHDKRNQIEQGLKAGEIRAIVATSSLELGIDMGALDLVLLVESPGSVARGLQRIGRAGHNVGDVSTGYVFPKFRGDLLECAVISQRMLKGEIEALQIPMNPLDVLAQQLVAMCSESAQGVEDMYALVRRSAPYSELSLDALHAVLDMLTGRYPSSDFADLKPLLSWDRSEDTIAPRRGAAIVMRMNAGTIPDRGSYRVHLGEDGPRVGELDEEMVFETRPGDNIMLGASTWRVESITRDRVIVAPAPGEPGRLPFWRGDGPGRPLELGRAVGAFVRKVGRMGEGRMVNWLSEHTPLDAFAAQNLAAYIAQQKQQTGTLPTDTAITLERFRDELGDWRICILTPLGARIHAPWAMALQRRLSELGGFETQVMYTDDGIVLRFVDTDELPSLGVFFPEPEEIEDLVTEQLASTALFAGLFRENAVRSLLLRRQAPGKRSPLWAQRLKAQNLLATVHQYPSFPIVIETYRQALADVFDLPGLKQLLSDVRGRRVAVNEVHTKAASPFARSLVFAYVANYLYEQDAPLAERKAQALTLDRTLLSELLGQTALRDLIDLQVLASLEAQLQYLAEGYRARDADEVHDMLRRLGDLSDAEVQARIEGGTAGRFLLQLEQQHRALPVDITGEPRWIAAEDAGLYRDATGTAAPAYLPDTFVQQVDNPLLRLLRRYARHHGPFLTRDLALRYAMSEAHLEPALRLLESDGTLVRGEIRPNGAAVDWCDVQVLRRLKRATLAQLRNEVAPVDAPALAQFLPHWHGLAKPCTGTEALTRVLGQLQDLALPWSSWHSVVLPQRINGFNTEMLDMLAASGSVVWVGRGASGTRDGRVAIYLRDHVRVLLNLDRGYTAPSPVHQAIVDCLRNHGASFLVEIQSAVSNAPSPPDEDALHTALWDLVWAGQITNDTFAPLRELGATRRSGKRARTRPGRVLAGGRWSLLSSMVPEPCDVTVQALARARILLDRYGVVSRECASAEGLSGGFGPLYKVLRAMEEQGQVRRGYFVEGLSGAQFAHAGAVDQLRALRPDSRQRDAAIQRDDVCFVSATDPANPYGALLAWPDTADNAKQKPRRIGGAWVLMARGHPIFYIARHGRRLTSFPATVREHEGALAAALDRLRDLPRGNRRGMLLIETIDGLPASQSPLLAHFLAAGYAMDYQGLIDIGLPQPT